MYVMHSTCDIITHHLLQSFRLLKLPKIAKHTLILEVFYIRGYCLDNISVGFYLELFHCVLMLI